MSLESDYQDVTAENLRDWGVQTPSPLVVCVLQKAYSGRFCFDWGQATHCSKTEIVIKEGDTVTGSASFEYGGGTIGVEVSHTAETEVKYETDACSICAPVMCFEGRVFIYECERFLGFWSWKTIDTVWSPSSRATLSLNCERNDEECGCGEKSASVPSAKNDRYVALAESARANRVVKQSAVTPNGEGSASESASLFAKHVDRLATAPVVGAERMGHRTGFTDSAGRVVWVYDSTGESLEFDVALLGTTGLDALRHRTAIVEGDRFPVMGVAPCHAGLDARVRIEVQEPGDSAAKERFRQPAGVCGGAVTSIFADVDLSSLPAGSTGTIHLDVFDDDQSCFRRTVSEPFVVRPAVKGSSLGGQPAEGGS